jgi:transmembrane sensor
MHGWSRGGLIAAGLLVLVGGGLLTIRLTAERVAPPIELATAVGARADHVLGDASIVRLGADSHASVAYGRSARDIYLRRGDAVFEVAKNPRRPFNVMAGDTTVTAVGTVFEVDKINDAVEVRVFEGVVRVSQGAAPPRVLRRGEWILLAGDHTASSGRLASNSYEAWRGDWLEADNMPLKYVVTRLNRYSPQALIFRDAGLGELRVTGRFKLNKPAEALAMISSLLELRVERAGRVSISALLDHRRGRIEPSRSAGPQPHPQIETEAGWRRPLRVDFEAPRLNEVGVRLANSCGRP